MCNFLRGLEGQAKTGNAVTPHKPETVSVPHDSFLLLIAGRKSGTRPYEIEETMKKISIGIMIGIIGLITIIFALPHLKTMKYFAEPGGKDKHKNTIQTKTINPMQEAIDHLLGIWTYTEPTNYPYPIFSSDNTLADPVEVGNPPEVEFWTRFQFNTNKICSYFQAFPTDNGWGKAHKCKWSMHTDKYANTGQRFYYVKITPLNIHSKFWRCKIYSDGIHLISWMGSTRFPGWDPPDFLDGIHPIS